MIICPKDCPDRKQGCHSQCEKYKKNLAEYRKRREWLDGDRDYVQYKAAKIRKGKIINAMKQIDARRYGSSCRLRGR